MATIFEDSRRVCRACGETLSGAEFRPGAGRCRACETVDLFRMARGLAALDAARAACGRRPWGMKIKRAAGAE